MTLAGNMKLKNFVLLGLAVVAAGSVGLYFACSGKHDDKATKEAERKKEVAEQVKKREAPPPPAPPDAAVAVAPPQPSTPSDLAARPYDAEVLAWKDKTIPGAKIKDASKGKSYKIEVYKDAGHDKVNRAKIDLDRDGKDDEKYTFEGEKITLQRAPADDEKFTEEYKWNGSGWLKGQPQLEKKP